MGEIAAYSLPSEQRVIGGAVDVGGTRNIAHPAVNPLCDRLRLGPSGWQAAELGDREPDIVVRRAVAARPQVGQLLQARQAGQATADGCGRLSGGGRWSGEFSPVGHGQDSRGCAQKMQSTTVRCGQLDRGREHPPVDRHVEPLGTDHPTVGRGDVEGDVRRFPDIEGEVATDHSLGRPAGMRGRSVTCRLHIGHVGDATPAVHRISSVTRPGSSAARLSDRGHQLPSGGRESVPGARDRRGSTPSAEDTGSTATGRVPGTDGVQDSRSVATPSLSSSRTQSRTEKVWCAVTTATSPRRYPAG